MATPNYKGQGQPAANSGGWLGSLMGGGAPAYGGVGQPASKTSGYLAGSAPAYKPAPAASTVPAASSAATSDADPDVCEPQGFAIVIPRQMIEQQ
jgi:hypothetical protein